MNTHKNARLTYARRLEMVQDITERGHSIAQAAASHGVSAVTARKWLGRFLATGPDGLLDKSSRPEKSPRAIEPQVALTIVELRRKLCLQAQIASCMGVSKATVSRVLKRAGLSKLSDGSNFSRRQHMGPAARTRAAKRRRTRSARLGQDTRSSVPPRCSSMSMEAAAGCASSAAAAIALGVDSSTARN